MNFRSNIAVRRDIHIHAISVAVVIAAASTHPAWGAGDDNGDAGRRARRSQVVEVVERTRNSVVNISSTQTVRYRRSSPFGFFHDEFFAKPETTSGSGFVIHKDGYIVTNHHVVARSADHQVTFADGRTYEAVVIAYDRRRDLAVLKIEPDAPLTPLKLGRSDDIMVGEEAIAIGNPFGLQNSVTRGVISAVNRKIEFDGTVQYPSLIQTDASINPGNSGGPLLNILGELIGVNTAIRPEAENVGFAIPVDRLRDTLLDMLDITNLHQVQFGMRVEGEAAEVVQLKTGSPAEKAGIRLGDIITDVDGSPIKRDVDFYIAMLDHRAGDAVPMALTRGGKRQRTTVRLTDVPRLDAGEIAWAKLGLRLQPLSSALARRYRLRPNVGLVVLEVDPRSPAERGGIKQGDLLVQVGDYRAYPLNAVGLLLEDVRRGDPVDVKFYRFYTNYPPEAFPERLYAR